MVIIHTVLIAVRNQRADYRVLPALRREDGFEGLTMTVWEWRNRHRRCVWCAHCEKQSYIEVDDVGLGYEAIRYYCVGKLKTVDCMVPRLFCRLFEQKKED